MNLGHEFPDKEIRVEIAGVGWFTLTGKATLREEVPAPDRIPGVAEYWQPQPRYTLDLAGTVLEMKLEERP